MRRYLQNGLVAVLILGLAGCYHATVNTGKAPSPQTIDKSWASGWIYGLVPPSAVDARQECDNGVAKVETKLSFANQLVGMLTAGIYTPMSIKVTCAQGTQAMRLPANQKVEVDADAGTDRIQDAFETAADRSARTGVPVFVQFED